MKFNSVFIIVCVCLPEVLSDHRQKRSTTRYDCQSNGYYADSNSCDIFYRCVKQPSGQYIAYKFSCSTGTVFSQNLIACTTPIESGRLECGHNELPVCIADGFIGDTKDCSKFYRCVSNGNGSYRRYTFTCGPGTVWDEQIQSCNHVWAVENCSAKLLSNIHITAKNTPTPKPYNSYSTNSLPLPSLDFTSTNHPTEYITSHSPVSSSIEEKVSTESTTFTTITENISQQDEIISSTSKSSISDDEEIHKILDQDYSQSIDQSSISLNKTESSGGENQSIDKIETTTEEEPSTFVSDEIELASTHTEENTSSYVTSKEISSNPTTIKTYTTLPLTTEFEIAQELENTESTLTKATSNQKTTNSMEEILSISTTESSTELFVSNSMTNFAAYTDETTTESSSNSFMENFDFTSQARTTKRSVNVISIENTKVPLQTNQINGNSNTTPITPKLFSTTEIIKPSLATTLTPPTNNTSKEDENPFENIPCLTPDKFNGTCRFVQECKVIYERHQRDILFKEDLDYMWRSQCGFFNRKIMVCCPKKPDEIAKEIVPIPVVDNIASKISDHYIGANINLLPKPGVCGGGTVPRLIFGTRTNIFDYPWMALLEYLKPDGSTGFHCGGSLINNRYVLTASHCVVGSLVAEKNWTLISVRLGEWDLNRHIDCDMDVCAPPAQDIIIQEKIAHENYIPQLRSQYYDIALLRLGRKVEYSDWIRPLCLPIADNLQNLSFENEQLKAVGWGKTENLTNISDANSNLKLHVNVNGVNIEKCSAVYRTERIVVNSSQMCAIGNGSDTCSGDSGGPLLAWGRDKINPRRLYWYCAGITSFGTRECAKPGWPGIYTRVSFFVNWIVSKLKG